MPYRSNVPAVKARVLRATDAGLIAAGVTYQNRMKVALRQGYTSGDFITGRSVNAVAVTAPANGPQGREVRVGTNLLYNLFWEVGHINLFMRRYVRVEKWRPTLVDHREDIRGEFARVFALVMGHGRAQAEAAD